MRSARDAEVCVRTCVCMCLEATAGAREKERQDKHIGVVDFSFLLKHDIPLYTVSTRQCKYKQHHFSNWPLKRNRLDEWAKQ